MWNPKYFHEMITKRVIITTSVLPSQSWMRPSSPTVCRLESTRASGWRSMLNTMPVIASDSTYGTKNSSRKMARPGKRRLSRTASASENGIWRRSDRTMTNMLLPTACQNTSLARATW